MTVTIPHPLRSYTRQAARVEAEGGTIWEVLASLDRQFPGLRFRIIDEQDEIRPHIKLFVNSDQVFSLASAVTPRDQVHLICALSGG